MLFSKFINIIYFLFRINILSIEKFNFIRNIVLFLYKPNNITISFFYLIILINSYDCH